MADGPLEINLTKIIRTRLGAKSRYVPAFALHFLEKVICQERLNELLRICYPAVGSEFSRRLLDEMHVSVEVEGLDSLPEGEAFEFASNHPLGGLDGITLVAVLGARYGDDNIRVLVNDMLMNVEPLRNVFLPINKYGSQGRASARMIGEAFAEGKQILMFPAGLVSRLQPDGGIRDLEWQKSFVMKAVEYGRRIVPVRFEGQNTMRFYRTAKWRKKIGLKVNVEQALLPSELCRADGSRFRIKFGAPVDPRRLLEEAGSPVRAAALLRAAVYKL